MHEGEFDFDELVKHLKKFDAPMVVNIHLDDTHIIHRVEYDSTTDTFVGFCLPLSDTKLPIRDTFCMHTFEDIENAFQSQIVAKYAHCIVAQPVDVRTPSFVLFIMGTDSSYDANVIIQRWKYIETELRNRGVEVLTFGADGAGPFLKAMVDSAKMFQRSNNNLHEGWDFFLMPGFPDRILEVDNSIKHSCIGIRKCLQGAHSICHR